MLISNDLVIAPALGKLAAKGRFQVRSLTDQDSFPTCRVCFIIWQAQQIVTATADKLPRRSREVSLVPETALFVFRCLAI